MRLPVYQRQVEATAAGIPTRVGALPGSDTAAIARGASAVGGTVDQSIDADRRAKAKYDAELEQEQHKADVVAARNQGTKLEGYATSVMVGDSEGASTTGTKLSAGVEGEQGQGAADLGTAAPPAREVSPGFLSTRGMAAAGASASTYESLEQRRKELSADLANDNQRALFEQHADQVLLEERRRIEAHTAQQTEVAQNDSISAAADEAVRAAAVDPGNDRLAQDRIAGVVGPLHALGRGQAFEDAKALDVQQRVASARISGLLSRGDLAGAERVLDANKWALGTQLDNFTKTIETAKASQGAEMTATRVALEATDTATGRIDEAKALDLLEKADVPIEARKAAAERLDHKLLVNERMWKQKVSTTYDSAFSVYLKTDNLAAVPPATKSWLIDNAPAKWDELEQKQARDRDRARRLLRGEHGDGDNPSERAALVELEADIVRNPDKYADMSPEQFNSDWGARLSPSGYKRGGALFANAAKGDRVSDGEFSGYVNQVVRTSPALLVHNPGDKREKETKKQLADGLRADFGEARRAFKDEHKRNPTMTEVQQPEFQKLIWFNLLKRSGVGVPAGEAAPESERKTEEPYGLDVKPSFNDRVKQLQKSGRTKDQARAILRAEGYAEVK